MDKKDMKKKLLKKLKRSMLGDVDSKLPDALKDKMSVKVIADSPEDLKKGLEKAEELVSDGGDLKGLLEEAFSKRSKKLKKEEE